MTIHSDAGQRRPRLISAPRACGGSADPCGRSCGPALFDSAFLTSLLAGGDGRRALRRRRSDRVEAIACYRAGAVLAEDEAPIFLRDA